MLIKENKQGEQVATLKNSNGPAGLHDADAQLRLSQAFNPRLTNATAEKLQGNGLPT